MLDSKLIDEVLEAVWIAVEDEDTTLSELKVDCTPEMNPADIADCVRETEALGLITVTDEKVAFTDLGYKRARNVIRRHRLAQRLLMDVLDVSEKESEIMACEFEHILSEEVTDKVAAFLGNPTVDPNNRPIPLGEIEAEEGAVVQPLISRLTRLGIGQRARVAFLAPSFHKRFDRLAAFGLNPGAILDLHQRKPAFVVRLGETELALDPEIAEEIYVRPI